MRLIDLIRDIDSTIDENYIKKLNVEYDRGPKIINMNVLPEFWMYRFKFRLDMLENYFISEAEYFMKNDILLILSERLYNDTYDKSQSRSIGFDGSYGCFTYGADYGFDFLSKEEIYSEDIQLILSKGRYLLEEY